MTLPPEGATHVLRVYNDPPRYVKMLRPRTGERVEILLWKLHGKGWRKHPETCLAAFVTPLPRPGSVTS